jgi:SAM-dependent methyltransferase
MKTALELESGHGPMAHTRAHTRAESEKVIFPSMIEVSNTIKLFLAGLRAQVSDSGLQYLRECFDAPECPPIDYDEYGPDFACGYFLQNYWKTCLAFLSHPTPIATKILDVGCGSGATSAAYLVYLDNLLEHELELKLILLDKSAVQIELAKQVLSLVMPKLRKVRVYCEYWHTDLAHWNHVGHGPELILQGHVLTENRGDVAKILSKMADCVSPDGRIYTIERRTDSIWEPIKRSIPKIAYSADCETTDFSDELTRSASAFIPAPDLAMKLMVLRAPERKILAELVNKYFAAWRLQRPEMLDEVFDANAEYREKPQDPALRGLDQIRKYWLEKVLPQRNLHVQVKKCSYTANEATAEWHAQFDVHDKRVLVQGVLVLQLNPRTGLVSFLREYFTTTKTPHP